MKKNEKRLVLSRETLTALGSSGPMQRNEATSERVPCTSTTSNADCSICSRSCSDGVPCADGPAFPPIWEIVR